MPIQTGNLTTQQTIINYQTLMMLPDSSVVVSSGPAVTTQNSAAGEATLVNYGTLATTSGEVVQILTGDAAITNDGLILTGHAYSTRAITMNDLYIDDSVLIENGENGQIIGGIDLNMTSVPGDVPEYDSSRLFQINNAGVISFVGDHYTANDMHVIRIVRSATDSLVENSGLISGEGGIVWQQSSVGESFTLNNSGEIVASAGNALYLLGQTFSPDRDGISTILNSGRIASNLNDAIITYDDVYIENTQTGVIEGGIRSLSSGDDRIVNAGQVFGDVELGHDNDNITNSGTIFGNVDLGDDEDRYISNGGQVTGVIDLGDGADFARVDQDYANLDGGAGNDTLVVTGDRVVASNFEVVFLRGSGDIGIETGTTDDKVWGNFGANDIATGAGADTVRSGNGDDTIAGGAGNDILHAGSGNDQIIGGSGRDLMTGGAGEDTFIFEATSDTGTTGATADIIKNFEVGDDLIDMSFLSNAGFIGTDAFSGSGTAEVRLQLLSNNNSRIWVDADGDGNADMMMTMLGQQGFTADDFIL